MNQYTKGEALVIEPEAGESYWQPIPSTGYITSKVTPYNSPYDSFAAGIQVLEPGASGPTSSPIWAGAAMKQILTQTPDFS